MEHRFKVRLDELLADAEVKPSLLRGMTQRLEKFLEPFVATLASEARQDHARRYVAGLLSALPQKNAEAIAYLHDEERQGLQKFIGQADWDDRALVGELVGQVAEELGEPDGVLVFDPSAFPKKGTASVGVDRQWCGRLGKVENCQVGIYLGYVSRREQALVDVRLYLPKSWTRPRLNKAGVPRTTRHRTRHELALEMLDEHGAALPHAWVAGDDEMGRCSWFRAELRARGEHYLLAVPSNTLVRDVQAEPPPSRGPGRRPRVPFTRVDQWAGSQPPSTWQRVEVRDAEKGPLVVEGLMRLVQARTEGRVSPDVEWLVVFRQPQADGTFKHDYLLGLAPLDTSLAEFARVFLAEHRIEQCLKRAKSHAGLAAYQVRTWEGWHHHQALALIGAWFLTQETRRGKKGDPGVDRPPGSAGDGAAAQPAVGRRPTFSDSEDHEPPAEAQRASSLLPIQTTQTLTTTAV